MGLTHFIRNAKRYAATVRQARSGPQAGAGAVTIPVYVINLERNEPRRRFILEHLRSHNIEPTVFPAVDGRRLDLAEVGRDGTYSEALAIEKFSRPLSPAEIGCAMSHLGVYRRIVESGAEMAVVLEDDAMLTPAFAEDLRALVADLPADWDLVQLVYACRAHEPVSPRAVRFTMQGAMPVAAAGYLLRASGARKILEQAYPIHYPADSLLGRSPRWGTNVYGARPQLVEVNNVFPSGILGERNLRTRVTTKAKEILVRLLG
jgi:glycosyl transferase family 25